MDKEVKSARKMAMLAESCRSCHMRRVLVDATLKSSLPSFPFLVPSLCALSSTSGCQVAWLGSLFGSSSTCHRSRSLPPSLPFSSCRQNIYVNDAEPATERCTALRCLFLSFGTHIKFVCGFVQRNMSLPEPELEQCGEGGGREGVAVAAAATTLNGNVRSSKRTHTHTPTHTSLAHSHNCCEGCSIDWKKDKQGDCLLCNNLFIYLICFI